MTLIFVYYSKIITGIGYWYSPNHNHLTQVLAFLRGELMIQATPYRDFFDYAWGNGQQQNYGLGIPLIRLPFECLYRLFGREFFPDRLVLVFLYWISAFVMWKAICLEPMKLQSKKKSWSTLIEQRHGISLLVFLFLGPALFKMTRVHMAVYDETITYCYFWCMLLFGLLLHFLSNPNKRRFLWLSIVAGLCSWFRPTFFVYGALAQGLAFLYAIGLRKQTLVVGGGIFLGLTLILLITNELRYGWFFEFGHALSFSNAFLNLYALRFDYPFKYEPFLSAAKELFAFLFFDKELYDLAVYDIVAHKWQSDTHRYREYYYLPYTIWNAVALLFAWAAVGVYSYRSRSRSRVPFLDTRIFVSCIFSISCFFLLTAFYLRSPSLTSRYAMDFAPAMGAGAASLYWLFTLKRTKSPLVRPVLSMLALIGVSSWIFLSATDFKKGMVFGFFEVQPRSLVTGHGRQWLEPVSGGHALPESYTCGVNQGNFWLTSNYTGWDVLGNCSVEVYSHVYLMDSPCIEILVQDHRPPEFPETEKVDYGVIQVRSNLDFLEKTSELDTHEGKLLKFCHASRWLDLTYSNNDYRMVAIGWIDLQHFSQFWKPPFLLKSIKRSF